MDLIERNLECIKNKNIELYKKVLESNLRLDSNLKQDLLRIVSTLARDGNKVVEIDQKDKIYHLNSTYRPIEEAKRWVQQYNLNATYTVVSMFGLGNGIFAKELCKALKDDGKLLIFEPSLSVLSHVIFNYDLQELFSDKKVEIFVQGLNDMEINHALEKHVHWSNINSQIVCFHPQYDLIFPESYVNFIQLIRDNDTATIMQRNTAAFLGKQSASNTVKNLIYMPDSNTIADYYDKIPRNIPAIIVGAGPSLDKNIDKLKSAQGKSIIFATDTSLKYLVNNNIIPDFIVTLDPLKSLNHFNYSGWENIPLLCKYDSHPAVLEMHKGKKIFYNIGLFLENFYQRLGKCPPPYNAGGSVSTAAFFVCRYLQFEKIVLIGQDLAYQGENSHAGGISFNARNTGLKTLMVEGIDGTQIKTRYDWYTYIQWYKEEIKLCRNQGIEVIDATEGGAKIEGSTIMSLEDVIHTYCIKEVDIRVIIDSIAQTFTEKEKQELYAYIKQAKEDSKIIEQLSQENADAYSQLMAAVQERIISNSEVKILEAKIVKNNGLIAKKPIFGIIDQAIQEVTTKQLANEDGILLNEIESQVKKYDRFKLVYKEIIIQSTWIYDKLNEILMK